MPRFRYQALNSEGQIVAGDVDADGVQEAVAQLLEQGLSIQSIGYAAESDRSGPAVDVSAAKDVTTPRKDSTSPRLDGETLERNVLRSHMDIILERGRALAPALRAYSEEMPNGWRRRQLLDVCRVLDRGDAGEAAAALADLPECWIPLLSAATSSGDLGHVLNEFLVESRRTDELRQKWWLTLAYPLILLALATVVMTMLSVFVIPEFQKIFAEFDLLLPELTMWVLGIGHFLSRWGVVILILLAGLFTMLVLHANRWLPESTFSGLGSRFRRPFGRRTAIARFARFMADLLEAGIKLPNALRIAGFTANQSRLQQAAWKLANDIELTGGFTHGAYERPLTASIEYALASDAPLEARVRLLREISNCHAERVRIGLSWATGIIEPLAICVVGFVVGCTVVALYLPLVKLVEGLMR
jgi:type II secretory pathway component PulF